MGTHRAYRERRYAFGEQLLTLRTHVSLTQIELADRVGVHRRSVQNWETGESYPKAEALQRLIGVLLRNGAFTAGQEREEAFRLWHLVAEDGPHMLAVFDETWFAGLIVRQGSEARDQDSGGKLQVSPRSLSPDPRTLVDWGEATARPSLYGRDAELQSLQQWVVEDRCRVVAIIGLGGIGKSSLAITLAHRVLPQFDTVLFRSLQNGPPLSELLDQMIRAISDPAASPPDQVPDKIASLVQLFRERRCLLVLDNFETILQPGALAGTYRTGYAEYGLLLQRLSEGAHQSCLLLTSREKPAELGPLEGRTAPVRTLQLTGLDDGACRSILEAKSIVGTTAEISALAQLYGGSPLALTLVSEPIRELFGGDLGAFLATGDAFFNGMGKLLDQQFARSTPLEQAILYWLAVERELVSVNALVSNLSEAVPQRAVLVALESLRRRILIERGPSQPAFTLQPVLLEYTTDQLVDAVCQEIAEGQPRLLQSHTLVQATARDYVRRSQEQLIATPLLERLALAAGGTDAAEGLLLALLAAWRDQPAAQVGYGPGNVINLLRLLRGHLRGLDLSGLAIRHAYLQGVEAQDSSLAGTTLDDSLFTEAFGIIHAVATSPDGMYWAASSINGTIRVWHDNGRIIHLSIPAHAKQVISLAFSPNSRILASGSYDCTIKLWDIANGALIRTLEGHSDYVQSVAFAPDGRLLASGSDDRTIRLWDAASGTCVQTLEAHSDNVYGVVWSPDGASIASCSFDLTLKVWDVASGACVQTMSGHTRPISKLAFSPDGRTLVSGGFDWAVKLWDVGSGQCLQTFEEHTSAVKSIAWSPDGRTIASASYDATIRLWARDHDTSVRILRGHAASVNSIAFTAEGGRLISGSDDHTVRVWDVASGWCVRVIQGYGLFFFTVLWSPDGQRLLSANSNATLTIWNVADGAALQTLRGHTHTVYAAAWSPDGHWLASGGYDQTIRIWEATTGACVRVIQAHDDIVYRMVWSPDGRWLASASRDQTVRVWDTATGAAHWVGRAHSDPINEVAWSPDGRRLASCGEDRTVRLWRAEDGMLLRALVGHDRSVAGVAWSPDGRQLASCGGGGSTGELFLWDAESGALVRSFTGHASNVFRVAWSMDGALLLSGNMTGSIRWWDVASGKPLHMRQAHEGWIRALSRSPDGTTLVSSGEDGIIQLWDIQSAEHVRSVRIDRPYERLDITGIRGITEAQKVSLRALGAADHAAPVADLAERIAGEPIQASPGVSPLAAAAPRAFADQRVAIGMPFQPTPFIGRGSEVAQIAAILANPQCRLLTLLGPGGIGKTRLALAVAAGHTAAFADGVAFVALASVGAASQIASAIGETLSLASAGQLDSTLQLIDYLRGRHMLLILDNFEHLLDGADLVADLLKRAPRITILVTSRQRLDLQAEWLFDVEGLAYPPEAALASTVPQQLAGPIDYSAVELFAQRARQIQPSFALSEESLATIVRICQQVAGMPLAIELAAAGVRALPIASIERQIRANLDVLATTQRDVPSRHHSMRAVFDHSWNLLSEPEQTLFTTLAVFRGGWTADAAAAVLSPEFQVLSAEQSTPELRAHNSELLALL
ncbi:MAG TPA: NB-ARC domain-containing protein, partial [Roseiflexaceae bacterium]|nr:NB-ARC domain-containing protein [Roseiflexaceae bacterium]